MLRLFTFFSTPLLLILFVKFLYLLKMVFLGSQASSKKRGKNNYELHNVVVSGIKRTFRTKSQSLSPMCKNYFQSKKLRILWCSGQHSRPTCQGSVVRIRCDLFLILFFIKSNLFFRNFSINKRSFIKDISSFDGVKEI